MAKEYSFKKQVSEVDLAYMAGLVDGEGCIRIQKCKNTYSLYLRIGMKDSIALKMFRDAFGGSVFERDRFYKQFSKRFRIFEWTVVCGRAAFVLKSIIRHLRIKRPQAELAIRFYEESKYENPKKKSPGRVLTDEELKKRANFAIQISAMKKIPNHGDAFWQN